MDKRFRIGVWVEDNYNPEIGGGFGYFHQIISFLMKSKGEQFEFKFISNEHSLASIPGQVIHKIKLPFTRNVYYSLIIKLVNKLFRFFFKRNLFISESENKNLIKEKLAKLVDVIYFPTPNCPIDFFPFIATVWDLGHLNSYSFPEVTENGEFERRSILYKDIISKALIIICESQSGKNEFLKYYPIFPSKIEILPLMPSNIISQEIISSRPKKLNIDEFQFIHYPAQFWSHKNHYNLILAYVEVRKQYPDLKLILTGADKGNHNHIFDLINDLGLDNYILNLGFVNIEELKWLYQNSKCLVMPTFIGPTNMPLLEAAALNCNVACSDLPGHFEQLGDYATYFNPSDVIDMAIAISMSIEKEKSTIEFEFVNYEEILHSIFLKAKHIRSCWS
jgi:glycosyltransferase involved in cell wall biosynthesis